MVESEVEGDLCPKQLHPKPSPAPSTTASLNSHASVSGWEEEPSSQHWDWQKGDRVDLPLHLLDLTTQSPTISCKAVMLTETIYAN